jgi:transcriptional regulator with XRE-family HTH domain
MPVVFSGARLRALTKDRGIRFEELATVTGLSFRFIDRLGRDEARPSIRTVEVLAEALGVEPGDLFADDGKTRAIGPPGSEVPPPPLSADTRERLRKLLDLRGQGAA